MPVPVVYPLINGARHSPSSIEANFNGHIFTGFASLNYKRERKRTMVYGFNADPLGKTKGQNEYSADCELYLAEWNLFQQLTGPGYGDFPMIITVTYVEFGMEPVTDILLGCTIDSTEAAASKGTDPLSRKIDLSPVKILFGGIDDQLVPLVGIGV